MRIEPCYYCSSPVYPGHGIKFVRNDAREFLFCQSKCRRHFNARHNPRKSKWTKAARKSRNKELCSDSVFEFEQRRNVPVRYNRTLYVKTIQAMKRLREIREARKQRFYLQRMRTVEEKQLAGMTSQLSSHEQLVKIFRKKRQERHMTISEKTKEAIARAVAREKEAMLTQSAPK